MKKHNCESCKLRAKHDRDPKSLGGRVWRWHINWCPGWRGYTNSLSEEDKTKLKERYQLR